MDRKERLEDLNLTNDELKRIGDAFKNEEFRKLFAEYAQEISDPENRRRYEEEITQMEAERGMDVTFINPQPSYVLKTSVNGDSKGFINICQNDKIDKPNCNRQTNENGKSGIMWNVPHSFSPPRDDMDKGGQRCQVFDVVYHPDTLRMAETNRKFKDLVESIALDGIERQFNVKLDRKNIKRPKLKYKGTPTATVIRSRKDQEENSSQNKRDENDILKNMPYPYDNKTTAELAEEKEKDIKKREEDKKQKAAKTKKQEEARKPGFQVPKYSITHRSEMDIQEFRNAPDSRPSTRPRELVVQIELPLLNSAASVNLDIFEQRLHLESTAPAAYQLDITLPYPVDDENGSAKFDKSKRCLIVTLPVVPAPVPPMPSFIDDSSGTGAEPEPEATDANSPPLIEVLSSSTEAPEITSGPKTNGHTGADNPAEENQPPVEANTKIYFSLPAYDFKQDAETLTFSFPIRNVCAETAAKSCPAGNEIRVTFCSVGSGCFPIHYSLFLRFPDHCAVAAEHCSLEVTSAKVTLLILKERSSRGLWEKFWAGQDKHSLEDKVFPSAKGVLQGDTEQLGQQSDQAREEAEGTQTSCPSQLQEGEEMTRKHRPRTKQSGQGVATRNEKGLTLEIKKREETYRDEEDDEYDEPLSAEIEIIYEGALPKLHGILKPRSSSESSDEAACSPLTPTDDELSSSWNSQRKSVSFNQHVDKTTFKTNSSVSSMKTALKSKRRRVRKNEEKKRKAVERQRRNSGGSEGSGSEEPSPSDSVSCSEDGITDDIDEELDGGTEDEETMGAAEEVGMEKEWAKAGVESDEMETIKAREEAEAKPSCKGTRSEEDAKILEKEEFRTTVGAMSPRSKIAKDVKAKLAQGPSDDKEDDSDDDAEGGKASTARAEVKKNPSQTKSKAAKGDSNFFASGAISNPGDLQHMAEESGASIIHVTKAEKTEGELGGGESVERSVHEKSDVETILSWDDPPALSDEHKTKCAFELQNAIMFDLDID